MENRCVGMGAPQNLCLAPTFLSVTLCHFQAAMKGQVANTGTVAVRSWGKLPSPVLVGLCERGVRGPCLLCPSAFSPRALGSALKRVPVAEGPSHPARGWEEGPTMGGAQPGPGPQSLAGLPRCVGPPSLALPAPLLLPPTICQRARLPPAPRGTAGAKTAICSRTSDAEGLALPLLPPPQGDTTRVISIGKRVSPAPPTPHLRQGPKPLAPVLK